MLVHQVELPDVLEIGVQIHGDHRGTFTETFRDQWFREHVASVDFVQENQSLSRRAGTIRGLHYQTQPFGQGKLVRCVAGAIFDVAVDIRSGSPTFGKWAYRVLTAEKGNQLWVPEGFLHGFCTLVDDTVVSYKVTNYYSKANDAGVRWNDSDIGVAWPDVADPELLTEKDRTQPLLREIGRPFDFAGASN